MTLEQKQAVALFRYSVIAPLITGTVEGGMSHNEFYRQTAQKELTTPFGKKVNIGESTIEKWYLAYQKHGFEGLLPSGRSDEGKSRKLDADVQERIRFLSKEYPKITGTEILRRLCDDGTLCHGQVSLSTIERFLKHLAVKEGHSPEKDMRRYEREHINEVWYGDTSFGPYLMTPEGKKRIYIIALIDDASRFITGADLFFEDTFANVMTVMKSAVSKHGKPGLFVFDNGSSYHNLQMELLCARIGSSVHFNPPYTPTGKAKCERWFSTAKMQYFSCLDMRDFKDLSSLRQNFAEYVRRYNNSPHSSLAGKTPQDRFFQEPERIKRLSDTKIETDFLFELERRVSPDSVVTIDSAEYEVPFQYAKQRIRLRYSPGMKEVYVAEESGELIPVRLLNKQENSHVKRQKIHLSEGGTQ